jgi:YggT family protein
VGPIVDVLQFLLILFEILIFVRILMSWLPIDRNGSFARVLFSLTEPILEPIRNLLPQTGMFDFSPMVVLLLIFVLQQMLDILR